MATTERPTNGTHWRIRRQIRSTKCACHGLTALLLAHCGESTETTVACPTSDQILVVEQGEFNQNPSLQVCWLVGEIPLDVRKNGATP